MRTVRMLDLHAEFKLFAEEIRAAVHDVLESQRFIGGPAVGEFEAAIADRFRVKHAVAVSSGTDALLGALMAIGVSRDDEVILPSFTFFATAGVVWRLGAKPVFVDIDRRTFTIDPTLIEAAITPKTKAIMPVHLFGQCAEMDAINAIAKRRGLKVIEDAAQAIGAIYRGRCAGTLGHAACLSFYPTKNLGGFGEGGMILTDDDELGLVARQLRHHGESRRYVHERVGGNFRLDTMKAAILVVKLRYLDEFTKRRRANAALYDAMLADAGVKTPFVPDGHEPVYHQYTILTDQRDELIEFLKVRGVDAGVYYPVPLHRQECFASLGYHTGSLPITEQVCGRVLSLPCHPMLSEDDIRYTTDIILEFASKSSEWPIVNSELRIANSE